MLLAEPRTHGDARVLHGEQTAAPVALQINADDDADVDGPEDQAYVLLNDERGTPLGVVDKHNVLVELLFYNTTGLCRPYHPGAGTGQITRAGQTWIPAESNYGKPVYQSAYAPSGWTGLHRDPFTGLYHAHLREYDPLHARWLSEDPMGYQDGLNLYAAYMGLEYRDPLGAGADPGATEAIIGVIYQMVDKAGHVENIPVSVADFENYTGKAPVDFLQRINASHHQIEFAKRTGVEITVREVIAQIPETNAAARAKGFTDVAQAERRAVAVLEQGAIDAAGGAQSQARGITKARNAIRAATEVRVESGLQAGPRFGKSYVIKTSAETFEDAADVMKSTRGTIMSRAATLGRASVGVIKVAGVLAVVAGCAIDANAMHEAQEANDLRIFFASKLGVPPEAIDFDNPNPTGALGRVIGMSHLGSKLGDITWVNGTNWRLGDTITSVDADGAAQLIHIRKIVRMGSYVNIYFDEYSGPMTFNYNNYSPGVNPP